MDNIKPKYLQARFCDFQIHSPRDPRYKGWPPELMTLAGLFEWSEKLLLKCRSHGLQAIAVTDHHDLLPGLIVLEVAYAKGFDDIWVFPGMEITSNSGIQAILLFDSTIVGNKETFTRENAEIIHHKVLSSIGQNITAKGDTTKKLIVTLWKDLDSLEQKSLEERELIFKSPKTDRLDKEFDGKGGMVNDLEREFREKFVLLPNLEKNKQGVFGNPSGRSLYLSAGDWFAGGIIGGLNETDVEAINGKRKNDFGPRVVACLRTSDQRGKDADNWFSDYFGQSNRGSWIKLSEPSTTSIKQALISGQGRRVFDEEPKQAKDKILRVWIEGDDIFQNSKLEIKFSPNLNIFIGGRGTGKSVFLSALVRLFGADQEWIERAEYSGALQAWEARHLALFQEGGPFSGNNVSFGIEYEKDSNIKYRLILNRPAFQGQNQWTLSIHDGVDWQTHSKIEYLPKELNLRPLFFLQTQMSTLTGIQEADQHDLTRLIEGPIREQRAKLRFELEHLSETAEEGYKRKQRLRKLEAEQNSIESQGKQKKQEHKNYIKIAQKDLDENKRILIEASMPVRNGQEATKKLHETVSETLDSLHSHVDSLEQTLSDTNESFQAMINLKAVDFSSESYLIQLKETVNELVTTLKKTIDQGEKNLNLADSKKAAFMKKVENLIKKTDQLAEEEKHRKEALQKAEILNKEIIDLRQKWDKISKEIKQIQKSKVIEEGEQALAQYKTSVKEYSEQLKLRAKEISNNQSLNIWVKIIPGGIYAKFLDSMREICAGCAIREITWNQLIQNLDKSESPATEIITEIIDSAIKCLEDSENTELPKIWNDCGFSLANFRKIMEKTSIEAWGQLSVVLADDRVDIKYKRSGKQPIPILNASPGERAVELLKLALISTEGPIIIDQPEDDLDNSFLMENMVDLIQQAKTNNQLIFASHNANIVVHGDADLIHVMRTKENEEDKKVCFLGPSGTIDQKNVCLSIEEIIEGGRYAFEHRRQKYHETVDPALLI